jgi:glycosyltransferase involved in cell wall biosynthesis
MFNKKVLHVVNISFVLPYYIGDQFDYFADKGFNFYVACIPSTEFTAYSKEKGFVPIEVNILRTIDLIQDLKAIFKLYGVIKREKIDVVVGHTPKGALIGMAAAYLAGSKNRVYFRHGLMFETSTGLKLGILKTVERFTGFLATKVVCVSPSVLAVSNEERLSAAKKNILLNKGTCNGIDALVKFSKDGHDPELISQIASRLGIKPSDRVIGFVGRLVNDKGINELLQAWEELLKVQANIKLLLIGPFEQRDALSAEAKSYIKDTPSVIHTGLINDISPYYCLMDIFILPSYREGFPTVVLEASAMEVPVLTTRATGCRDSIIDNETGLFITLDPIDIGSKIKRYLNDPELGKLHGKNGRAFVLKNFDRGKIWNEIAQKVYEVKAEV